MKYFSICLDGIDKSGKDTILGYIDLLSNHKYVINSRGILSQIAYSKLYNRDFVYDLSTQEYIVNVLLTVNKNDWEIRCKLTNEPKIDFIENSNAFIDAFKILKDTKLPICTFNTSDYTPYMIAREIIQYMNTLNGEEE